MDGKDFEALLKRIGRPFYRTETCALYCGRCEAILPLLPKGSVALTVTSPPYNIGKEYEEILPLKEYLAWCSDWLGLIHTATAASGALMLNLGYLALPGLAHSIPIPYLLWERVPFFLRQEIVWNYAAGVASKRQLSPRNEKVLWYTKSATEYCFNLDAIRDKDVAYPNQKRRGKLRCNPLGKNPSDVWRIPKVTSGSGRSSRERTSHPAQTPLALGARLIRGFSNVGDMVLDPFAGSGSILVAASLAKRYGIGVEMRRDYCEMAAQRMKDKVS